VKVKLIQSTNNVLDIMHTACRTCYSEYDAEELYDKVTQPYESEADRVDKLIKRQNLILKVLRSNHMSIAEHIYLTFTIDGITRKTSHQLVRHRMNVYSQKSQRYVTYHKPFTYSVPPSVDRNKQYHISGDYEDGTYMSYDDLMDAIQQMYNRMIDEGIPAEDARDIFPNACHTSIVMSCNLRQFIHMCNERLCLRAQTEIREMFALMCSEVLDNPEFEFLGEFFTAHCKTCTEFDGCKKG